jgi:hypothetical protein
MAVAHTMAEEIELQKSPLASAILRGILEPSQVWDKLRVKTVRSLEVKNRRWKSLPTVSFAHIGESYGSGIGKTEAISFGLKHLGHDFDIPIVYEHTDHIVDPKTLQMEMALKSLSYLLNDTLVNGDMAVNPRAFDGLKKLSAALPARQNINANLSIVDGGASTTVRHSFLDLMARAKRRVEDGAPDLILMNENVIDLFESVLRREGLYATTLDQFEREISSWRGVPFVDAGFKDIEGQNYVLGDDHDVPGAGAGAKRTSIYFLKLDPERHIGVLQVAGLNVRNMGELEARASRRHRLDWTFGVVCWGKRSMVRISNLQVTAA